MSGPTVVHAAFRRAGRPCDPPGLRPEPVERPACFLAPPKARAVVPARSKAGLHEQRPVQVQHGCNRRRRGCGLGLPMAARYGSWLVGPDPKP